MTALLAPQFFGCVMLFAGANLLACLCANLLQGRFNKATQDKLTEALRKARRSDHLQMLFM